MCVCVSVRFIEMTKTMFPVSREMKRVGSYALVPKIADDKSTTTKKRSGNRQDEGGQKFD